MSLDGLRAWIGEVERKLGVRTRVFWVLTAIAIGAAGAGIFLALKAADDSASKGEAQALREQVEASAGEAGGTAEAAALATLRAEVEALRTQVGKLEAEAGGAKKGAANSGGKTPPSPEGATGKSGSGKSSSGGGPTAGLKELVEKAEEGGK